MTVKFSVMMAGTYPLADYVTKAQAIERLGFDEIHIADDLIMRPAWPILTLVGAHTSRVRLGPAIVTPQVAHPVYHAANLAALDELTGGRAICGVGRGGFNPLIGVARAERPLRMLREAVEVMRHMLAGERSAYQGDFFTVLPELQFHFAPVQREIPIFIGTWGPRIAGLAGRVASGLKADCTANPDYLRVLVDSVQSGARQAGRDPDTVEITVGPLTAIGDDAEAARREMRRFLAIYLPYLEPMTSAAGIDAEEIAAASRAVASSDDDAVQRAVSDRALRAFSITGTPGEAIAQIEALIDAGATHVCFGPPLGAQFDAALELIGTRVLPYFREHSRA